MTVRRVKVSQVPPTSGQSTTTCESRVMNLRIKHALLVCCIAILSSCVKQKLETEYNNQETKIESYITKTKKDTMTVTYNGGSSRLTLKEGTGETLQKDGAVSFYYAGYMFNGSISNGNLFGTNHQATAEKAGWDLTDGEFNLYETDLTYARLLEGVRNGLIGVKAGEECEILFTGKYGFGNSTFGIIPANSALAFKIWVVGVSND